MFNCVTNLNLQVNTGDRLNQVSSCCCCNLEAEDADLFIVKWFNQTDETCFSVYKEGPSLVAVDCLSSNYSEEPGLSRAHVHRA